MPVNTSKEKIDEILIRSIDTIYPNKDAFEEALFSGKQLRIYMGIDPTSAYVHIGHSTNYIILKRLHELGHKIIVLIGDFTAMIGDPSDKSATRVQLSKEQVKKNLATYKEQIGKILDFENKENPIEVRFNSEWLSKLNFEEIVDIASNFTVQQMIERDIFQKRLKENKPLYLHEFLYPLMQGYDSVALDVDVEVEGTDQIFNMLAGNTLIKAIKGKNKISVATTLLENPVTGEKLMSKSLGTGIGLDDSPNEMFGKTMALPDEAIVQVFIDCTFLPMEEIDKVKKDLETGANPRDKKIELAYEIVKMYHNESVAQKAEENFVNTFSKGEIPTDIQEITLDGGQSVGQTLVAKAVVSSGSEWRRLVSSGAIETETGEKISEINYSPKENTVLKIGKKRFVKIVINK